MPSPEEISAEKERLYESSSLRDDLNDSEATVLLKWGETQIDRLATEFPDEFEQKARFLRQLLKNINRFVGQREFNEMEGQQKYMKKVSMYLSQLGWTEVSEEDLFSALPEDKTDMAANLDAILTLLSPAEGDAQTTPNDTPTAVPDEIGIEFVSSIFGGQESNNSENELENSNLRSINQEDTDISLEEADYGEE